LEFCFWRFGARHFIKERNLPVLVHTYLRQFTTVGPGTSFLLSVLIVFAKHCCLYQVEAIRSIGAYQMCQNLAGKDYLLSDEHH